jgi:uncharacterized protein YbjT (DUF2867 family)
VKATVLGGKGLLGSHLVPILRERGYEVTVTTRRPTSEGEIKADFLTGEGMKEAISDAEVVVHLVSDAARPKKTDIEGTRRLLPMMNGQHLVYMSIVGVDRHPFAYYRAKHETEQLIEQTGAPHSILRATQFHDFIARVMRAACKPPLALIPKRFVFQPIDTGEVAAALAGLIESRSPGLQPDLAGPQVLTAEHLARTLMEAIGRERPMLNLPVPGKAARAFRDGLHTNTDRSVGAKTWNEYLEQFRDG